MRPEALEALLGCELIIHAGDVGGIHVLDKLRTVAPVVAIRGNVDREGWARALPNWEVVEFAGVSLYVLHSLQDLDLDPVAAGFAAVISGHSHKPAVQRRDGILLLNPGSAGPRRFRLPVSLAVLIVLEGRVEPRLVELELKP
jgi:putative phosphoesterase